jgi:hypothetical protein
VEVVDALAGVAPDRAARRPDKVDHEMVAVPKFWTAPPPFVPAVLRVTARRAIMRPP